MTDQPSDSASSLSDLPDDELVRYARELGMALAPQTPRGELLRRVRERQTLIEQLEQEALLDVVQWMRWPVRKSAAKDELVRHVARCTRMDFDGLSQRGLEALAHLRGVAPVSGEPRDQLETRLRKAEKFRERVRRVRRSIVGGWVERLVAGSRDDPKEDYQFLPDKDKEEQAAIRRRIESVGVVGGIARTLRGVADDYVREKLDDIERRIDAKLDEIDKRLEEWRDREVANRIRILRITLVSAIIVAAISLGYDYLKARNSASAPESGAPAATNADADGS